MVQIPTEDLRLLRQFADDFVKRRLDAVPGVAAVIVAGGFEEEVHVQIDQERLAQLDLSVQDLANRLQATNVNLSGGSLKEGRARIPGSHAQRVRDNPRHW